MISNNTVKGCTKCGELKKPTLFPKNKLSSDGLGSWCKTCVAQNAAAYSKTEKGKAALKRGYRKQQKGGYFRYGKGGFLILRDGAARRGVRFSITEAELETWWLRTPDECTYCGVTINHYRELRDAILRYKGDNWEIRKFMRFYRSPKHRGIDWMTIDRAENARGYELSNMVKCCWICNSLKSDFFTPQEMQIIGRSVLNTLEHALKSG
jgi:hypothetical protein